MKIEDLAYRIAGEALNLLEERYHYRISEESKRGIAEEIRDNLNRILTEGSSSSGAKDAPAENKE